MTWYGTLIVFITIWWCLFFMLLPVGVRPTERAEPGHDPGSPNRQRLGPKIIATSLLAVLLTGAIWASDRYDWIDFRGLLTAEAPA